MTPKRLIPLTLALSLAAGSALASEPYIYPKKGQSEQQQEKDKFDCYQWAKKETDFDPMKRPEPSEAPPPQDSAGRAVVRGAGRGAAVGAVGGAIGGDAGKGAAVGAAVGGMAGGMRRRGQQREQEQWAEREAANYDANRGEYNRAYGACLEGRDYTVK